MGGFLSDLLEFVYAPAFCVVYEFSFLVVNYETEVPYCVRMYAEGAC